MLKLTRYMGLILLFVLLVLLHVVENGRFVQEWTIFDEFALLKQLYRPS